MLYHGPREYRDAHSGGGCGGDHSGLVVGRASKGTRSGQAGVLQPIAEGIQVRMVVPVMKQDIFIQLNRNVRECNILKSQY